MSERRELVFFSDRDLAREFPALLVAAGVRIERHDDHFGPETPDEEGRGNLPEMAPESHFDIAR